MTGEVEQDHAAPVRRVDQPLALLRLRHLGDVDGEGARARLPAAVPRELEPEGPEHVHHEARAVEPAAVPAPAVGRAHAPERLLQHRAARQRARGGDGLAVGRVVDPARVGEQHAILAGRGDEHVLLRREHGAVLGVQPRPRGDADQRAGQHGVARLGGHGRRERRVGGDPPERVARAREQHPVRPAHQDLHGLLRADGRAVVAVEGRVDRLLEEPLAPGAAAERDGRGGHAQLRGRPDGRLGERRRLEPRAVLGHVLARAHALAQVGEPLAHLAREALGRGRGAEGGAIDGEPVLRVRGQRAVVGRDLGRGEERLVELALGRALQPVAEREVLLAHAGQGVRGRLRGGAGRGPLLAGLGPPIGRASARFARAPRAGAGEQGGGHEDALRVVSRLHRASRG
ncbi:MAG: hypothetical protein M5U28_40460 [Sandaracinaceae bacterium]|nr:hypothetical protein [Sandaracinaceae bacterium]